MSDELDWLSDLVPKTEEAPAPDTVPENVDMLDDLREEMVVTEPAPVAAANRPRVGRSIGGLLPWQVFFLSVLMFLDVAIVGLLFLVMLGRIVIP